MPDPRPAGASPRQLAAALAPAAVALLVFLATWAGVRDRLPDPVATHFSGSGEADGFTSRGSVPWLGALPLLGGALLGVMVARQRGAGFSRRALAGLAGVVSGLLGYLLTTVLHVNADAPTGREAELPLWQLPLALGVAALVGLASWYLAGPDAPAAGGGAPVAAAGLRLGRGEAAVWSRRAGSRALSGTAVVSGSVAVLLALVGSWGGAASTALVALVCGLLGSVRVTVDRRGVLVRAALLPRPRVHIPLERIAEAHSRPVAALGEFGGWGYRVRPGASGLVLRSGEALAARLRTGREFVVTVDDSATAAALLNGLIEGPEGGSDEGPAGPPRGRG